MLPYDPRISSTGQWRHTAGHWVWLAKTPVCRHLCAAFHGVTKPKLDCVLEDLLGLLKSYPLYQSEIENVVEYMSAAFIAQ